jgi:hypothetical protein
MQKQFKDSFKTYYSQHENKLKLCSDGHVGWVPCHHGMARPQVADRGDALQFWRAAANILNKQSRRVDKGGPPAWGLGVGLTTPHRKK